jgi:hypothetical protein
MKITIHIYQEQYTWEKSGRIEVYSFMHYNSPERLWLDSHEIDLPGVELMTDATRTILQIAELREEAAKLQSKVNQQLSEIERKIVAASQLCNR